MYQGSCSKICSGVLLFLTYHLIILLLALMNTAIWTTELPKVRIFHHPSLYAVVKGFNAFFGTLVVIVILIICFKIGDRVLRIANLRIRANYNLYLFLSSFLVVFFFPIGYVGISRYIGFMLIHGKLTNFALLTLICFVAIDSLIIFVFAIFLLLTSIMSTLRSYNIFRHLVKLNEKKQEKPGPKITTNKRFMKKKLKQTRNSRRLYPGVYSGRNIFPMRGGVYPHPLHSYRGSEQQSQASKTSSQLYRAAPMLLERYGYVVTPTLTLAYPSSSNTLQQQTSYHPLSDSAVFLV